MIATRLIFAALLLVSLPGLRAVAADNPRVSLTLRNHRFEPVELEVPSGQKIELHVINADPTPAEFESADLHREKLVPGNQEVVIFIGPLRAGRFEFFDDYNPATARGHIVAR
jgi:hypothetical protein